MKTPPYRSRIVVFIEGIKIELARWKHIPGNTEVRLMTRGLSCPWFQEKTLGYRDTITPRWQPPCSHESSCSRAAHASSRALAAHARAST